MGVQVQGVLVGDFLGVGVIGILCVGKRKVVFQGQFVDCVNILFQFQVGLCIWCIDGFFVIYVCIQEVGIIQYFKVWLCFVIEGYFQVVIDLVI